MKIDFCETEETKITATENAMNAAVVAAAGRHNILLVGEPGCGKTNLAQAMRLLIPNPTKEELESIMRIHSIAGLLPSDGMAEAPFRMPHQSASLEGMCGGGPNCKPGEISLAHNGVLVLEDAAEFRTTVLQCLRIPLESGNITLSRAGRATVFPADFQLVMTANPCPCGNYGSEEKLCLCTAHSIETYWKKFSAPLLDRVEIAIRVKGEQKEFDVAELRKKIAVAVEAQRMRGFRNGKASIEQIGEIKNTLGENEQRFGVWEDLCKSYSARKGSQLLKIARTFADLDGRENISEEDLRNAAKLVLEKCGFTEE